MTKTYREIEQIEDFEAWKKYGRSNFRWVFNKLEVAIRQGLSAGPSATAPDKPGSYIIRPIYNIYGMGLGAKKFDYDPTQHRESFLKGEIVPPGHFWTEWLPGIQLSVDYKRSVENGDKWVAASVLEGAHKSETDLTKFAHWKKVDVSEAPGVDSFALDLEFLRENSFTGFNIEFRGGTITEVHLRLGNEYFDDLPVGAKITPIWDDMEDIDGEWRDNPPSVIDFSTDDKLSARRLGFRINKPIKIQR